jgi:hypothetical protein
MGVRAVSGHRTHRASAFWVGVAAATLLSLAACRRGVPVVDTGPRPQRTDGTISGTVRGPRGASSIEGRTVEVINTATNERQHALTNTAGGFTFKVKPGKYRVELSLREGEHVVTAPGVIDVNRSDVDASADFVIAEAGVARPRYHAPRADDGLGAAIA